MHQTSIATTVAAAMAALFVSATAFAEGTFTPEIGIGHGSGKQIGVPGDRSTWTWNVGFGYTADNGFGARVVTIADGDIVRGFLVDERTFDNFVGAEATYALPLRDRLKLTGGLGVGRTKLDDGNGGTADSKTLTDGLLSLGLQYRFGTHYAMELRASHLTSSGVTSTTLQAQIPF